MSKSLIVKHSIRIEATPNRVWEVLTKPDYIRQWGFLPEDFGDFEISPTTIIEYPDRRLNVVEYSTNKSLRYELYVPTWEEEVNHIGYTYTLSSDAEGHTWLSVEIGDFAILVEGDKYYGESTIFGETASAKIKDLAETRQIVL